MAEDYKISRLRADKVLPDVKWVLRKACDWKTEIAPEHLDNKQATDVVATDVWGIKKHVAVRSRSYGKYFERYGNQFTLRSKRSSGAETELSKICKGFGDYLLYGFLEGFEHRYFYIIDLIVFRVATTIGHDAFSREISNNDGTFFRAYSIEKLSYFPIIFKEGAC